MNQTTDIRADRIALSHGGGGKAMHDLIDSIFAPRFQPDSREDQARLMHPALTKPGAQLAFTTDSFVVSPLEFPGGDIGKIAICGTVNDLAVGGARPLWLSAGFILEEGFDVATLIRIVDSMARTAKEAGVRIVTGDTKVVDKGKGDGVFINTAGVGVIPPGRTLEAARVQAGDVVLVNHRLGDHGAAILAARGDLALDAKIESDCQPLNSLMEAVLDKAPNVHAARDATRGGLASCLNEIAKDSGNGIVIQEEALPIHPEVRAVSEILGLDPLYLANEGTMVLFAPADEAEACLKAMQGHKAGEGAAIIGKVVVDHPGRVVMNTLFGGSRIVDMLTGEQLPRIC
nr:hydrogenase expression/formation protein HypE [uncultured Cohaesibacter sp.]